LKRLIFTRAFDLRPALDRALRMEHALVKAWNSRQLGDYEAVGQLAKYCHYTHRCDYIH
jgi:hypothetical protein